MSICGSIESGKRHSKSWTVKNVGDCVWEKDEFELVPLSGDAFLEYVSQDKEIVVPGDVVTFTGVFIIPQVTEVKQVCQFLTLRQKTEDNQFGLCFGERM